MIKNVVICDRCKQECKGDTFYTIEIYGHDIYPKLISQSFTTMSQNLTTNMYKAVWGQRQYCMSCKDKFEKFLRGDG